MSRRRPTSWLDEVGGTNSSRPVAIPRDLKPFDLEIPSDATPRSLRANSFPASVLMAGNYAIGEHESFEPPPMLAASRRPSMIVPSNSDALSHSPTFEFNYQSALHHYQDTAANLSSHELDNGLAQSKQALYNMHRSPPDFPGRNSLNAMPLQTPGEIDDEEDMERITVMPSPPPLNAALAGRGKVFCVVGFKCWRADIYVQDHRRAEFTEELKKMDIVVVEADRGNDIGTILFTTNSAYKAERYCHVLNTRHTREIVRSSIHFSQYWRSVVPPMATASQIQTLEQADNQKKVRRKALPHEIVMITDKEYIEVKAKRTCQHYVQKHGLNMEILDAEFQADYQKLTFFYFAPHYVTFNALVHDLYKCFKKRIWMSAVNNMAGGNRGGRSTYDAPMPMSQYGEYQGMT